MRVPPYSTPSLTLLTPEGRYEQWHCHDTRPGHAVEWADAV